MNLTGSASERDLFAFTEAPGPHAVGLRVIEQYDHSRIFRPATDCLGHPECDQRTRPLQTLVWYPALSGHSDPMTVGDYLALWASETKFANPSMPEHGMEWSAAMAPSLTNPLWATRDAAGKSGSYPLVVYAPSFSSTAWENADLCELLASHGYVVVACPNMGPRTRAMSADLAGVNAQARDICFLIGNASGIPNVNCDEIAVIGFSWGGISNLFAAARDDRIKALVALDGSMRYWPGLVEQAGDIDPSQMKIPLLYMAKGDWTLEEQELYLTSPFNRGKNVLNSWGGDLLFLRMLGMTHRQFSSMFQRNEDLWLEFSEGGFPDGPRADYTRADGINYYGWMTRYTLRFLDGHLKKDPSGLDFISKSPSCLGVPEHMLALERRPRRETPSFDLLRSALGRTGFEKASETLKSFANQFPDFALSEADALAWAEELIDAGHTAQAIVLLELNADRHAGSSVSQMALGRAYQKSGDTQRARAALTTAARSGPFNVEARRRLSQLGQA